MSVLWLIEKQLREIPGVTLLKDLGNETWDRIAAFDDGNGDWIMGDPDLWLFYNVHGETLRISDESEVGVILPVKTVGQLRLLFAALGGDQ